MHMQMSEVRVYVSQVVQWFGTTARGVIADNNFTDMNVCSSGYGCKSGDGALGLSLSLSDCL